MVLRKQFYYKYHNSSIIYIFFQASLRFGCLTTTVSFFFFFFYILGPHPQHMEVPKLGIKSELQLLAYTTVTAMQDPSLVCNLHHSSWQCPILNPLRKARDPIRILMDTSWVHYHWAMMGTPSLRFQSNIFIKKEKLLFLIHWLLLLYLKPGLVDWSWGIA